MRTHGRTPLLALAISCLLVGATTALAESGPTVTKISGGSVQTRLSRTIAVNKDSSLEREWVTIHDPDRMRADITDTGIQTVYVPGSSSYSRGNYEYRAEIVVRAEEPLAAIRVTFILFDVWGERMRGLRSDEVLDMSANTTTTITPSWHASEHDVSNLFASIAYVSVVRTAAGDVVRADNDYVLEQARVFSASITESELLSFDE